MRAIICPLVCILLLQGTAGAAPKPEEAPGVRIIQSTPQSLPTADEEEPEATPPDARDIETQDEDGAGEDVKSRLLPQAQISTDLDALPLPVARMREALLEAARSGEIENLQPLLDNMLEPVSVSFGGDVDAVPYWKEMSGDGEGIEILSIMIEILETGYAVLDAGTDNEIYIWPYFYALPFDELTKPQLTELYKLITPADMEDMRAFGGYIFYRLGISRDGQWRFFVAGD